MVKEEVFIEKPVQEVWDFIVLELAKSFKCSPSKLQSKEIETTVKSFGNNDIKIKQFIGDYQPNKRIEIVSEGNKDIVKMVYELTEDNDGTFLMTFEVGEGKSSFFRTMNYKFMSLPIMKRSTSKRLRQRLETMKGFLEGTLDLNQDNTEEREGEV